MFEKELKFALNNGWAIDDFIAEMTNDNETIYLLEPEEISIVQKILPHEFKEGLEEDEEEINPDIFNCEYYGYTESWTNYCLISHNTEYIPIFYTENFYDYIHELDEFSEEKEEENNNFFQFMVEFMEHYPNFIKNMYELRLKKEEIIEILKRNYEKWNEKRE